MRKIKCLQCEECITPTNLKKHYLRKHSIELWNDDRAKEYSKCKFCGELITTNLSNHTIWCDKNPNKENLRKKVSNSSSNRKHSDETKKMLSEKRKFYLSQNKELHVWKRNDKFKSKPCEVFKNILRENNISFLEEYNPIDSNNYSIDIAFPNEKIGVEINGNQHYNSDKTLKEYYQKRHNLIESHGWKLFQIHYSLVYREDFILNFISELKNNYNLTNIDYSFKFKKNEVGKKCECGVTITKDSKKCNKCVAYNNRKVINRPKLDDLLLDVEELGYRGTGRKYNVSDNCIRKWIKQYQK